MAKTVIGFFDEAEDAQKAMQRLQQTGISQNSIDFTSGGAGAYGASSTNVSTNDRQEEGNAITRFFNSLFGDDSDDARKYSRVGSNSNYIITVHASSADEAEQAADIMDDCGAIDVDERASGEGTYNDYNNVNSSTDRDSGDKLANARGVPGRLSLFEQVDPIYLSRKFLHLRFEFCHGGFAARDVGCDLRLLGLPVRHRFLMLRLRLG